MDTYVKIADKQILQLTLADLKIDQKTDFYQNDIDGELVKNLVVFSPTDESHLGNKFDFYKKLNDKTLNEFIKKLIKQLGVKNHYFFHSYTSKSNKTDLKDTIINDNESFICLYIGNGGIKNSLYKSIRNALAHGNIIHKGKYYLLYSITKDNAEQKEYDARINFLLKIHNLKKSNAYTDLLNDHI